jgi:crotonobetainyl-CoA:carnitine CoA-transferase CaiB-like acyl-CoA transferase
MVEKLRNESFGPLNGVRILSTGTLIAEPFAASLAADMGAEVIQVERPEIGDRAWRTFGPMLPGRNGHPDVSSIWAQERRNVFSVTLNLSVPRGRDLFLRMAERADIWMENSKAGTYEKWGLADDAVLAVNPRLVITHVSGFGQTGDPAYRGLPSYDSIGQAFGGTMYMTGFPDPMPPTRAAPWIGDYITALFALWASLAGVIHARATGQGQSIDLAQYEALHRLLGGTMIDYFRSGIVVERSGNKAANFQPGDTFKCRDGWIVIAVLAGEPYDDLLRMLGLDPSEERWQRARTEVTSPDGLEIDRRLREWTAVRTTAEALRELASRKVPSSTILSAADMAAHPQYRARGVHVEWDDVAAGPVKGIGIVPRFSRTPGRIVRGAAPIGYDNRHVYVNFLEIEEQEFDELVRSKVI